MPLPYVSEAFTVRWSCQLTPAIYCREGRVLQADGKDPEEGLYVVGWAKRGPTGIIGEGNVASMFCLQIMAMALLGTKFGLKLSRCKV
jgi:NADPH-dependent glutamate synthase beta subunit-like oxidoreductase